METQKGVASSSLIQISMLKEGMFIWKLFSYEGALFIYFSAIKKWSYGTLCLQQW